MDCSASHQCPVYNSIDDDVDNNIAERLEIFNGSAKENDWEYEC